MTINLKSFDQLLDQYEAFFFDAFGVLVDGRGPLPGSLDLIEKLHKAGKKYWIVSNGASKSVKRHWRTIGT